MTDMQSWALAFGCASVGWACSSTLSVRFREKSVQITEIEKRLDSIIDILQFVFCHTEQRKNNSI